MKEDVCGYDESEDGCGEISGSFFLLQECLCVIITKNQKPAFLNTPGLYLHPGFKAHFDERAKEPEDELYLTDYEYEGDCT